MGLVEHVESALGSPPVEVVELCQLAVVWTRETLVLIEMQFESFEMIPLVQLLSLLKLIEAVKSIRVRSAFRPAIVPNGMFQSKRMRVRRTQK